MFILQLSKYTAGHKLTPLQISLFFCLLSISSDLFAMDQIQQST